MHASCTGQIVVFPNQPSSNAPLCFQSCCSLYIVHLTRNFQSCFCSGAVWHVNARILYRTDCHFLPITLPAMHHSVFSHAAHCTPFKKCPIVLFFNSCVSRKCTHPVQDRLSFSPNHPSSNAPLCFQSCCSLYTFQEMSNRALFQFLCGT